MNIQQQDDMLWKIAKRRATFKWSFSVYVFVNTFLISVWYFTSGPGTYFLPVWPMLGWGIGILFQYLNAYQDKSSFSTEQEYERLKRQQNNPL